jgi:hypothetical protein
VQCVDQRLGEPALGLRAGRGVDRAEALADLLGEVERDRQAVKWIRVLVQGRHHRRRSPDLSGREVVARMVSLTLA